MVPIGRAIRRAMNQENTPTLSIIACAITILRTARLHAGAQIPPLGMSTSVDSAIPEIRTSRKGA